MDSFERIRDPLELGGEPAHHHIWAKLFPHSVSSVAALIMSCKTADTDSRATSKKKKTEKWKKEKKKEEEWKKKSQENNEQ